MFVSVVFLLTLTLLMMASPVMCFPPLYYVDMVLQLLPLTIPKDGSKPPPGWPSYKIDPIHQARPRPGPWYKIDRIHHARPRPRPSYEINPTHRHRQWGDTLRSIIDESKTLPGRLLKSLIPRVPRYGKVDRIDPPRQWGKVEHIITARGPLRSPEHLAPRQGKMDPINETDQWGTLLRIITTKLETQMKSEGKWGADGRELITHFLLSSPPGTHQSNLHDPHPGQRTPAHWPIIDRYTKAHRPKRDARSLDQPNSKGPGSEEKAKREIEVALRW